MKLVNDYLGIEEREYNGIKYYVLVIYTDDKEQPVKEIGVIKKYQVRCYTKKVNN